MEININSTLGDVLKGLFGELIQVAVKEELLRIESEKFKSGILFTLDEHNKIVETVHHVLDDVGVVSEDKTKELITEMTGDCICRDDLSDEMDHYMDRVDFADLCNDAIEETVSDAMDRHERDNEHNDSDSIQDMIGDEMESNKVMSITEKDVLKLLKLIIEKLEAKVPEKVEPPK